MKNANTQSQKSSTQPRTTSSNAIDYKKVGLRCGIEIHQQLEGKKLFCDSPTVIRDDKPHFEVRRTLRAVVGETGQIDGAAALEQAKQKQYIYEGYADTIGLVELDEEPPHTLNEDALVCAVQVANMLDCVLVDEVQIMRKTVVDGSNTSGFQRTALVGQFGALVLDSQKKIRIPTVIVEEDAAKRVREEEGAVRFNLSRLGIPLLEISTDPDLHTPQETKEAAEKIGLLIRATGMAKRGLGTIRQDVNVSIAKGSRVEIKGAQDLDGIPTLVEYEIMRQQAILSLSEKLYTGPIEYANVTNIFTNTQSRLVSNALKNGKIVYAGMLPQMAGLLELELQPNKRLGSDLSDYLKVHHGLGGLIHSDEDFAKYSFTEAEVEAVRKTLKLAKSDAFVLIVGEEKSQFAFSSLNDRLTQLSSGVPSEVRKANPDYTTSYMRPMPGSARMYPETDCIPVTVPESVTLPERIESKIERYVQAGLAIDEATTIARGEYSALFDSVLAHTSLNSASVSDIMFSQPVAISRKLKLGADVSVMPIVEMVVVDMLAALEKSTIAVATIPKIYESLFMFASESHWSVSASEISQKCAELLSSYELMSRDELEVIVKEIVSQNPDAPKGKLMGLIMAKTQGRADGKVVQELLSTL